MKILLISDEESTYLWDHFKREHLNGIDLIISCGDLKASYLSFLVTMGKAPVFYIHGNHDCGYAVEPPEGCDCIEDMVVSYKGLRIMGLGGSRLYSGAKHQYTEKQMRRRISKLRREIDRKGGVDIVVTHAPAAGIGDLNDPCHRGFECFIDLMDELKPKYLVHGHVHLGYAPNTPRIRRHNETVIINACGKYILEIPDPEYVPRIRKYNPLAQLFRKIYGKETSTNFDP